MDKVVVFDTAQCTDNLGDYIIMEAVWRETMRSSPNAFHCTVHTHDTLGKRSKALINQSSLAIVGGTNLLCSHWWYYRSWQLSVLDIIGLKQSVVLLGAGWLDYQRDCDALTACLLRKLLSRDRLHSVRDNYTRQRLERAGIGNVVNTACPTMWSLTEDHCHQIPDARARDALVTVTAYRPDPDKDRRWLETVQARYRKVWFWSQMYADLDYVRSLVGDTLEVIAPNLAAFDEVLENQDVDFVGTRLHGGIRALHKKRRALIIEVDHRATEIAKDTNLATIKRGDNEAMLRWIDQPAPVRIDLPWEEIARWRDQFGAVHARG